MDVYITRLSRNVKAVSSSVRIKTNINKFYVSNLINSHNKNVMKMNFEQMRLTASKFLSNEYRPFPVDFKEDLCKDLKDNRFGLGDLYIRYANVTGCPIKKVKLTSSQLKNDSENHLLGNLYDQKRNHTLHEPSSSSSRRKI